MKRVVLGLGLVAVAVAGVGLWWQHVEPASAASPDSQPDIPSEIVSEVVAIPDSVGGL
jgi:hypothetical protein